MDAPNPSTQEVEKPVSEAVVGTPVETSTAETAAENIVATAADKPNTSDDNPVETATDKPVETSTDKPVETSTDKPVETSTDKPVETSTDKPVETSTDKPVETSAGKPVETSTDKFVEIVADKPVETSTDKPVETSAGKPVETSTDKRVEISAGKPVETAADKPVETSTDKPVETSTDKPVETAADKPVQKPVEEAAKPAAKTSNDTPLSSKKATPVDVEDHHASSSSPMSSPIRAAASPSRSPAPRPRPKASTPAPTSSNKYEIPEQLSGSTVHRRPRPRTALTPLVHTRKLQLEEQEHSIKKLYDESINRKQKKLAALEKMHNASMVKPIKPMDGDEEQQCVDRLFRQSTEHKAKVLKKNTETEVKKYDAYRKKFGSKDEESTAVTRLYSSIQKGYDVQQSLFDKYNPKPKKLVKSAEELAENDERFYKGNFGRKGAH